MNEAAPASEISARLELARRAAYEAGRLTLRYFQQENFQVERKTDDSPVTVADRQAEQLLRQRIAEAFPADGIVGEEFENVEGSSPYRWILDPIDGTKSFISGVPLYGTMVGVQHGEQAEIGVVYIPGLSECIYAARGQGCWYELEEGKPRPARVSNCERLADGLLVTTQIDSFAHRGAAEAFPRLEEAAWITRTWGDCYGYLLVATGRAVAMIDPIMNIWDAAALQPILEEAGGAFTDWQGRARIDGGDGVGTNGRVADEVLAITREFPPISG